MVQSAELKSPFLEYIHSIGNPLPADHVVKICNSVNNTHIHHEYKLYCAKLWENMELSSYSYNPRLSLTNWQVKSQIVPEPTGLFEPSSTAVYSSL